MKTPHSMAAAQGSQAPTLSISLLAWRLKLLKNIFLLSKCISSTVDSRVAALFPTMPLKAKNIHSSEKKAAQFSSRSTMLQADLDLEAGDTQCVRLQVFKLEGLSFNP